MPLNTNITGKTLKISKLKHAKYRKITKRLKIFGLFFSKKKNNNPSIQKNPKANHKTIQKIPESHEKNAKNQKAVSFRNCEHLKISVIFF